MTSEYPDKVSFWMIRQFVSIIIIYSQFLFIMVITTAAVGYYWFRLNNNTLLFSNKSITISDILWLFLLIQIPRTMTLVECLFETR